MAPVDAPPASVTNPEKQRKHSEDEAKREVRFEIPTSTPKLVEKVKKVKLKSLLLHCIEYFWS